MEYSQILRAFRECKSARHVEKESIVSIFGNLEIQQKLLEDLFPKCWHLFPLDVHQMRDLLKMFISVLEISKCEVLSDIYDLYIQEIDMKLYFQKTVPIWGSLFFRKNGKT